MNHKLLVTLLAILFASCVSNKRLVYLQNKKHALADTAERDSTKNYIRTAYKVQINDILSITIRTLDEKAVAIFNNPSLGPQGGGTGGSDIFYLNGYSVDTDGNIDLPVIGKLKIEGLTLPEVKVLVIKEVERYLREPIVSVKFGGIRYTILGEVNRPGKNVVLQGQLNLFEAVAFAGDLTPVANRQAVQIVRQYANGPKIFEVDLTDRDILYSPYYFIQPNDIIYVRPLKVRSLGTGITGVGTFQTIVSVLSALILIISISRIK